MSESREMIIGSSDELLRMTTRRRFLRLLGAAGSVVFLPTVFTACNDTSFTDPTINPGNYRLDLTTDAGILNYAYAMEQLEAAFYTAALASSTFATLQDRDKEVFNDLQKHEVIHRELLRQVLGTAAIPTIAFNASIMAALMTDGVTLLKNAQLIEDTGVSAYNGAGKYLSQPANLVLASKIVSVEARHAAAIRDIRDATGRLFAGDDVVSAQGLDVKSEPSTVIASVVALNVLVSPVSISNVPTVTTATPDSNAPTPT